MTPTPCPKCVSRIIACSYDQMTRDVLAYCMMCGSRRAQYDQLNPCYQRSDENDLTRAKRLGDTQTAAAIRARTDRR